jgi:hypothetical protein
MVINIKTKNDESFGRSFNIHICIRKAFDKALIQKVVVKKFIPTTWGLFKLIKGLEQVTHFCLISNCNKILRLDISILVNLLNICEIFLHSFIIEYGIRALVLKLEA